MPCRSRIGADMHCRKREHSHDAKFATTRVSVALAYLAVFGVACLSEKEM